MGVNYNRGTVKRDGGPINDAVSYSTFVKSPKSFLSMHALQADDHQDNLFESRAASHMSPDGTARSTLNVM